MQLQTRLIRISALLFGLLAFGTYGFVLIEGWAVMDGIYMTLITLSTVGFSETHDLSFNGRIFTSLLVVVSMIGMVYWTASVTSVILGGELSGTFRRRKEVKMIFGLTGHTVVCGDGLLSRTIVDQLVKQNRDVVFLTKCDQEIAYLRRMYPDVPVVEDDPTSELALADTNILNAHSVVASLESDVDNLMVAITCKGLGTDILVICCAQCSDYASRMLKVGADQVICLNELGGRAVASLVTESTSETT